MVNPVYPLFVLELDDHSFREVTEASGLDWCERIDIEDGLFEGWDSSGRHFSLEWDQVQNRPSVTLENDPNVEGLCEAVEQYVKRIATLKKIPDYLADPSRLKARAAELSRAC
jgi:hypothetical protein